MPYKAENWHAPSHEQYFSEHRFLDICQYAFNFSAKHPTHISIDSFGRTLLKLRFCKLSVIIGYFNSIFLICVVLSLVSLLLLLLLFCFFSGARDYRRIVFQRVHEDALFCFISIFQKENYLIQKNFGAELVWRR